MNNLVGANLIVESTGVLGVYEIGDTDIVRIAVENAGAGNQINVEVKLEDQSNWSTLKTLTANEETQISINTYEELRLNCVTFDGSRVKLLMSGFMDGC